MLNQSEQYLKLNQQLQTARKNNDTTQICLTLARLGFAMFQQRHDDAGLQHFEEAIELAATSSDIDLQVRCLNLKMLAFQHVSRLPDAYTVAEEILQLGKTHHQPGIQCDALTSQGQILLESGDPPIAAERLQVAQQIAEQLNDKRRQMNVLGVRGHVELAIAATEQAGLCFKKAQLLAKELDDTSAEIGFEGNNAIVLIWQGHYTEAIAALERVKAHARATGNPKSEIQTLRYLIKAHTQLQNHAEIIDCAQRGLELADPDDTETRLFFLSAKINALHQQGQTGKGKTLLIEAMQLIDDLSTPHKKLDTLLELTKFHELLKMPNTADVYLAALDQAIPLNRQKDRFYLTSRLAALMTDHRQFIEAFEARLPQITAEGDILTERTVLHTLINHCVEAGETDKAITHTQRALTLAKNTDDPALTTRYRFVLVDSLFKAGRYPEVMATAEAILNDYSATLDKATELQLHQIQSEACIEMNQLDAAANILKAALPLPDQIQQPAIKARLLGRLGSIYAEQGDLARANTYTTGAIELARSLDDLNTVGELLCVLALNYRDMGDLPAAINCCREAIAALQTTDDAPLIQRTHMLLAELEQ